MPISRTMARLLIFGLFLTFLALLRQRSFTNMDGSERLREIQSFNQSRAAPRRQGYTWHSINHSRTKFTRMLVVPSMKGDDTSWIARELPDLNTSIYVANDPSASLHPPKNKGHEVMVYLTFIIDHYNELPDIIIFMHAHRWTHHNNELLDNDATQMIRRLSNSHVFRQGYVNMRCQWTPGCPEWLHPDSQEENLSKQEEAVLLVSWNELFPSDPIPRTLSQPCCAQFALSRQRIHSIPLSQFAFFRDWMLRTPLNDYSSGRIWEYSWQYLFTNQSVACPAEHLCYCDAYGICFGGATEYSNYQDMQRTKLDFMAQIEEMKRNELFSIMPGERSRTANNVSHVEFTHYSHLHAQVKALDRELEARKLNAMKRGSDPKMRAEECGRQWNVGNGF